MLLYEINCSTYVTRMNKNPQGVACQLFLQSHTFLSRLLEPGPHQDDMTFSVGNHPIDSHISHCYWVGRYIQVINKYQKKRIKLCETSKNISSLCSKSSTDPFFAEGFG